jgi:hypothetical protein
MRLWAVVVLAVCGLVGPGAARADYKEVYTVLGYEAGASHYLLPAAGSGSGTSYAGGLDLSAYYGLTNAFHVGGRVRVSSSSDVHFTNTTLTLADGTKSQGDVYTDHRALGFGALILYRLDVGALAPIFELEAGFTSHQYRNVSRIPANASYSRPLDDFSETVLHGSGTVLLEYRFRTRWIVATGVGVELERQALTPWSVFVPFRVGCTW